MHLTKASKTVVQCDFDGTITEEDVGFMLLDIFARGDWRRVLEEYKENKIPVGHFNSKVFALVKADKQRLLKAIAGKVKIRAGFHELVAYCRRKGFRFVIVSNGLDFYIQSILRDLGTGNIEIFAAQTRFLPEGLQVQYIGPEGHPLDDGFKEAYVSSFLKSGCRVIYVGNGTSDISPAGHCQHVFATDELLARCRKTNLDCSAFTDFSDVLRGLEHLP